MPYLRPTLTALQQQAIGDITAASLPSVTGQVLPTAVLRVLSYAMAGLAYLHYSYLDWIAQQSVPYTATDEYLEAWAALKGVIRKPAEQATGQVGFTGVSGSVIPMGAQLSRQDGTLYVTEGSITLSGGVGSGTVIASVAGTDGNCYEGTVMTLSNAITGVNANATTTTAFTGGADIESTDALRTRMLFTYANPPSGGSATDYIEWAEQVPGVTRAWCLPNGGGSGTVVVYPMFDVTEAAYDGFPQPPSGGGVATSELRGTPTATGDCLAVANYIYPLRPVTSLVYVYPPTAQLVNLTIANLTPTNAAIQAAISAAITATFVDIGSPLGMTLYESDLTSSIASVPGVQEFVLVSPATTTAIAVGSLPVLGTVTYE